MRPSYRVRKYEKLPVVRLSRQKSGLFSRDGAIAQPLNGCSNFASSARQNGSNTSAYTLWDSAHIAETRPSRKLMILSHYFCLALSSHGRERLNVDQVYKSSRASRHSSRNLTAAGMARISSRQISRRIPIRANSNHRSAIGPLVLPGLQSFEGFANFFSTLGHAGLPRKFLGLRLGQCRPFRLDFVAQNSHQVGPFRTWRFRFDGERGEFSKNVGLRTASRRDRLPPTWPR